MKKVKVNRQLFRKQYETRAIKTKNLSNFEYVQKEKDKIRDTSRFLTKAQFGRKHRIINSLIEVRIEEFEKLFGRQDFILFGEYKMYVWVVEHEGCEAMIFSGEGYGTVVEIILNERGRPKGSINKFFDYFFEMMKDFEINRRYKMSKGEMNEMRAKFVNED